MRRRTPGVLTADELLDQEIVRAETERAERVVAILEPLTLDRRRARLRHILERRLASVQVVFDAPHDPHNGAAVVRSCEAFGVQFVHVVEREEHFLAAGSVARGAQQWIDVLRHRDARSAIATARSTGMELVAAHPEGELVPSDLAHLPRVMIVLGNERDGISRELEGACTRRVRVPMRGFSESLNVSVTAAILLSAATAERPGDLDDATLLRLYARGLFLSVPRARQIIELAGEL